MSAITNVIRGRSPYSRVGSTANFPWSGFSPGYGLFTVGSTPNAGGGIGHMAGTLLGTNVESTGDHVRYGAAARGASNGLFSTRAHLAMFNGGVIGEPVVGVGTALGQLLLLRRARPGGRAADRPGGPSVVGRWWWRRRSTVSTGWGWIRARCGERSGVADGRQVSRGIGDDYWSGSGTYSATR
jgi:hypothetical protein